VCEVCFRLADRADLADQQKVRNDAQRWCQVQCEAVEVFEDLPPVTSLPLD